MKRCDQSIERPGGLGRAIAGGWVVGLTALVAACASAPDRDQRVAIVGPDRAAFPPVAAFLEHGCGTLDCHGQIGRNLRLYGFDGLRLSSADLPGGQPTTSDEADADFDSVVGLEPELMAAVVADGGARPERLTLVRKGRGTEHHKGGALIKAGDAQDRCLLSWLANAVDPIACTDALKAP
jgi:hypothetical protein